MPLSWRPLARGPASSRRTVAPEDVFTVRRYGTPGHNTAAPSAQLQQSRTANPQVTAPRARSTLNRGRSQVTCREVCTTRQTFGLAAGVPR